MSQFRSAKLFKYGIVFVLVFIIYVGFSIVQPHEIPQGRYQLQVKRGDTLTKITHELYVNKITSKQNWVYFLVRLSGKDKKIAAGMYIFHKRVSVLDLVQRLISGKPDEISISIADGWSFQQIRSYLAAESQITHITSQMSDSAIRDALQIKYPTMEGLLYPDTYFIVPAQTDLEIMQLAYKHMQEKLAKLWQQRQAELKYKNSYDLLIMASLIQKEAAESEAMTKISAVFNNRLRIKMRLQNDPAVFYGLANKERITRADFAIDTPYNTYLHAGLPPSPICSPSLMALEAAANPSPNKDILYFIATKDGQTKFSRNFSEHSQAVDKYLKKK